MRASEGVRELAVFPGGRVQDSPSAASPAVSGSRGGSQSPSVTDGWIQNAAVLREVQGQNITDGFEVEVFKVKKNALSTPGPEAAAGQRGGGGGLSGTGSLAWFRGQPCERHARFRVFKKARERWLRQKQHVTESPLHRASLWQRPARDSGPFAGERCTLLAPGPSPSPLGTGRGLCGGQQAWREGRDLALSLPCGG